MLRRISFFLGLMVAVSAFLMAENSNLNHPQDTTTVSQENVNNDAVDTTGTKNCDKKNKKSVFNYKYYYLATAGVVGAVILAIYIHHLLQEKKPIPTTQPTVSNIEWGVVTIQDNGKEIMHKNDCKIWPTGWTNWDWRKTDTHHVPGISQACFEELINEADTFILSRGMNGVLQVEPEAVKYLQSLGKTVHTELTRDAVAHYNKLVDQQERVAILIHSTC